MSDLTKLKEKFSQPGFVAKLRALGDILRHAIPLAALIFVALDGLTEFVAPILLTYFVTQAITEALKKAFNKTPLGTRPDGGMNAMPSAHTSSAFSGAWMFYFVYGPTTAAVPIVLATVVAISRVLARRHWVRDVVVGALLAFAVAYFFIAM